MKKIRFPMLQLWLYHIRNNFKRATMPKQLDRVEGNPSLLPEYKRQVEFLRRNNIDEPYDCFQCQEYGIERSGCHTPYQSLYMVNNQSTMCPGFNPLREGKFVWGTPIVMDV